MYQQENKEQSILLIVLDLICLSVSYFLGVIIWQEIYKNGFAWQEINIDLNSAAYGLGTFLASYILICLFSASGKDFIKRGNIDELFNVVRSNFTMLLVITLMLYLLKNGDKLSRGVLGITILVNVFLTFLIHLFAKKTLRKRLKTKKVSQMLVVTTSDRLEFVMKQLLAEPEWGRRISGICILDEERQGEEFQGVPIVANYYDMLEYTKRGVVDEVFIHISYATGKSLKQFILELEEMGITVHLNINVLDGFDGVGNVISNVHGFPVITFSTRFFRWNQLFIKRVIDICGSLVGLLITAVVTPFVAIPLLIESPGPLFFKQKRVGRNGRYFMIYKFRSMYMDAEERKKELMAQNEMQGAMFKMKDDPRVTKVGKFIRATSIDELPQFWNVLIGDMSLVGTRPPTVDEFQEYSPYHKRRLSLKPGLTGMWQVSGRSDISDFEEVVRLDLEYIDNWSIMLDIKIILKTVIVVLGKVGSR